MTKFLGWLCTVIWICVFVSNIVCVVNDKPVTYNWIEILLRDALIIAYSAVNLIREYF